MPQHRHQGYAAGTRWDPGQYTKFSNNRLRPALELFAPHHEGGPGQRRT